MSNVTILVGAQWGDEGKGKWVDILAEKADYIARFQGGNNAGHTLYIGNKPFVLHQIPSGVLYPNKTCILSAGVVVNPVALIEEIGRVKEITKLTPDRLWLSARSHVISPWHIYEDSSQEMNSDHPIGTTKRGIGPTYAYKANRTGLRLGSYIDGEQRYSWIKQMQKQSEEFCQHYEKNHNQWDRFNEIAELIRPYVCDAEKNLRDVIKQGHQVLLEGAQGSLLDINHGTYPYVTSSSTAAGGALGSIGFPPNRVDSILGVAKAYATRVGEGPFPTEQENEIGQKIAQIGHEKGATTGRPRRCGWLDAVALRYSVEMNGIDQLILNKVDVLDNFEEIKIAIAYQHPQLGRLESLPWDSEVLAACIPIYETLPGWKSHQANDGSKLPDELKHFIERVSFHAGVNITMLGTGVNRQDAIFL